MQKITLILGGARSGKSAFGEKLALSKNGKPIYIFTAQSFDEEMDERIRIHRGRRGKEAWQDVEANINLASAVSKWSKKENVILVDCLSLWLTNLMTHERNVDEDIQKFLSQLEKSSGEVILTVSYTHLTLPTNREV